MRDFEEFFDEAVMDVMRDAGIRNTAIDQERLAVLQRVCSGFSEVFGEDGQTANMEMHPAFRSGGISIKIPSVRICPENAPKLQEILELCEVHEMLPLTTERIEVTAVVSGVFKKNR